MRSVTVDRKELKDLFENSTIDDLFSIERMHSASGPFYRSLQQEESARATQHHGQLKELSAGSADENARIRAALTRPGNIVRTRLEVPGTGVWSAWYFRRGDILVRITEDEGEYLLFTLPDEGTMLSQIQQNMALDRAFGLEKSNGHQRSNGALKSSSSLQAATMTSLFDQPYGSSDSNSASEAQICWQGQIDVLSCRANQVVEERHIFIRQGFEQAWIAVQDQKQRSQESYLAAGCESFAATLKEMWRSAVNSANS